MKKKIKNIVLIILSIALVIVSCYCISLKHDYSINEHNYQVKNDSLCSEIVLGSNRYDSLKSYDDSVYQLQKASYDSLMEVYELKLKSNKNKITYIYKDSIIIKEQEQTEVETKTEIQYVEKEVIKEVVQVVHDTISVSKVDTVYQENKIETSNTETNISKDVVKNDELFNIYLNADVKGNLDFDIVPEIGAGIIIKEKFYGEIQADYDKGKVNPSAKLGVRLKLF